MRALMLIVILSGMPSLLAKDAVGDYSAAEDAYRQGDFAEASRIYLAAIQDGAVNASLFYNLGTSLYKKGETGAALAAHLRARSLDPGDPDIRYNLRFLQDKSRDKLETRLAHDRWHDFSAARWLSERALFWWAMIPLILALNLAAWQLLSGRAPIFAWVLGVLLVLLGLYPGLSLSHWRWQQSDWGAVAAPQVDVLASPTVRNAVVIFQLHEGAPFAVINESGEWFKIQLSDGKTGWAQREHLAIFGEKFFSYQFLKNDSSTEKPAF